MGADGTSIRRHSCSLYPGGCKKKNSETIVTKAKCAILHSERDNSGVDDLPVASGGDVCAN